MRGPASGSIIRGGRLASPEVMLLADRGIAKDAAPPTRRYGTIRRGVRRAYRASGADLFGAIVAETFLNRAKTGLADIKGRVRSVESLDRFVAGLEISAQEIFAA